MLKKTSNHSCTGRETAREHKGGHWCTWPRTQEQS